MTFPNRVNYRLRSREKSRQLVTASDTCSTFEAFRHVTHEDVMAVALQCCHEEKAVLEHALLPLTHKLVAMISQPAKLLAALVTDCNDDTSKHAFWVKAVAFQHVELGNLCNVLNALAHGEWSATDVTMLKTALYLWRLWQFVSLMCVEAVASIGSVKQEEQVADWSSMVHKRSSSTLDDQNADALTQGMVFLGSGLAKRSRITKKSNEFLVAWFLAHKDNPYPSPDERSEIAEKTGLAEQQVRNWFANMRKRHWKPNRSNAKKPRCLLDYVLRQTQA